MKINIKKTKVMVESKKRRDLTVNIQLDNQ